MSAAQHAPGASPPEDAPARAGFERVGRRFSMLGRRALVTGGSLSIGRAIALGFADAGADVAVHYAPEADRAFNQPSAAESAAEEIRAKGRRAVLVPADFDRAGEGTRTVEAAAEGLGGLDVLVVCASIQYRKPLEELTPLEFERQVNINFRATIELLQAALPRMKAQGFGRIVTIGSINQTKPEPTLAVYAALKSAQANLAMNFAREVGPFGVTVNNISPGLVATERNRWRREDAAEWAEIQRTSCPLERAGFPEEIVGAALLLCSEAGSFMTGADVQVTGGRHL